MNACTLTLTIATVERMNRRGAWEPAVTGLPLERAEGLAVAMRAETGRPYRVVDTDATTGPMADAIREAERAVEADEMMACVDVTARLDLRHGPSLTSVRRRGQDGLATLDCSTGRQIQGDWTVSRADFEAILLHRRRTM